MNNGSAVPSAGYRLRACSARRVGSLLALVFGWSLLLFRLDQVPPGFQHDQMFNATDALTVVQGQLPIYFPANFGREPLAMYTAAAIFRLVGGPIVWDLRFSSVIWGMIGLAATIALGRRYLPHAAALFGAALMAASFWFLLAARLGLEPIAAFALGTVTLYLLSRGLSTHAPRDYAAAGLAGGLTLYTYPASRVLCVLVPLMTVYEGARTAAGSGTRRREGERRYTKHEGREDTGPELRVPSRFAFFVRFASSCSKCLLLTLLLMLLVASPLFVYLATHAGTADARLDELSGALNQARIGNLQPILYNTWDTIRSVLWVGSGAIPYQYNIPGRPVLQPLWAIFCVLGLVATLVRWRRREEFLLLAALAAGLGPSLASGADALYMRDVIALPLIFILVARGLWAAAGLASRWASRFRFRNALLPVACLCGLLAWQTIESGRAYFVDWAQAERTQRVYNADFRAAAAYLEAHPTAGQVFIGSDRLIDLDARTYRLYQPRREDAQWFRLPEALPLPAAADALYLVPSAHDELPASLGLLAGAAQGRFVIPGPTGKYDLMVGFHLARADVQTVLDQAGVQVLDTPVIYGDTLRLDAAGLQDHGSYADLITRWTVLAPWPRPAPPGQAPLPPKFSLSLRDGSDYKWAQADQTSTLPLMSWQPGDSYVQASRIPVPGDMPPAGYTARLVVYDDAGGPLAIRRGETYVAAPAVAAFAAEPRTDRAAAPTPPLAVEATSTIAGLELVGRWEDLGSLVSGVPVDVHLSWRARKAIATAGLSFHVRAADPEGQVLWEEQVQPTAPLPAAWPAGQTYRLSFRLRPETQAEGTRTARIEICPEIGNARSACVAIANTQITNQPPLLALPTQPQHLSGAEWGGQLALAGYDMTVESEKLSLTLYWRTEDTPARSLQRFVHVVDGGGQMITQTDSTPANGAVPITAWRRGEYVVDRVDMTLRPGQVPTGVYVGWYDPATGVRLPVRLPSGEAMADNRLLLR